jgi:cobalamin biosynthesis Mg chelatase CobN
MEWLKSKGSWILVVIFAGLFAWKMLSPEIKTTDRLVEDTTWKKTMDQKIDTLTTQFSTQMSSMQKQLDIYKEIAKNVKTVSDGIERYDPNTGKLIEKIYKTVTEDKSKTTSTTESSTTATTASSTASTASSTGTTASTDSGAQHIVDNKTSVTNPQAIASLSAGLGMKTLDGFKPSDADLAVHVNLFGIKAMAMESYEFIGQQDIKDRFKTHVLVTIVEFK